MRGGIEGVIKKSFYTILLVVAVNFILFFLHIIAIFGLAFNDSGDTFPSVLHLLPFLLFCVGPLAVGSYFLIRFLAKKIEFYEPVLYVVQGFLVVCYMLVYIHSYVPTSAVRTVADDVEESRAERKQEKRNEEALKYLGDGRVEVFDEIENGKDRITIYICHDSEKVVFRHCDDAADRIGYCTADVSYFEGPEPDSVVKYRNLETGNTVLNINYGWIYLDVGENRYLCLEAQDLDVYYEGRKYTNVGFLYFELLNRDVIENNCRYLPNDIIMLEIEEEDMVCWITEESLNRLPTKYENGNFSYGWTILRNGQIVVSGAYTPEDCMLDVKALPGDIWKPAGTYEVYLHTYFRSNLPGTEYSGYIKASNSITWEIPE